jgi:hypothetical protein
MSDANVLKSVPIGRKNGPRRRLRGPFPLVALERVWSNKMLQKRQNEISVTDVTGMVSSPASQRQRITARLRAEVINTTTRA